MEAINKVVILSLRELEEQKDTSLFIINNTQPRGEIIFNVTTARGKDHTVIVPDTWIPFDLTTQAKKTEIIDSPDFRRAVSQRYLVPVSTGSADEFMNNSELGRNELDRVFNRAGGNNVVASNSTFTSAQQEKMAQIRSQSGGVTVASDVLADSSEAISGAVIQIVNRSNLDGEDKMEIKEALSLLVGRKLNSKELDYIVKNSVNAEIKAFASKQLS